ARRSSSASPPWSSSPGGRSTWARASAGRSPSSSSPSGCSSSTASSSGTGPPPGSTRGSTACSCCSTSAASAGSTKPGSSSTAGSTSTTTHGSGSTAPSSPTAFSSSAWGSPAPCSPGAIWRAGRRRGRRGGRGASSAGSAAPPLLAGTWTIARAETRALFSQVGLYIFIPLILLQTLGSSLLSLGAFQTELLLTPGLLAVGALNTLSFLLCLLLMFYTVESLERERVTGLA